DHDVMVISPAGIEPVVHTARASLLSIHNFRMSGAQKQRAVKAVYDYIAGAEYGSRIVNITRQKLDLESLFKDEVAFHGRTWKRRTAVYNGVFGDISAIDTRLRQLLHPTRLTGARHLLTPPRSIPAFTAPK